MCTYVPTCACICVQELALERAERQRMKEEWDGIQTRLNDAEMVLQMMEKKEKESLRQVGRSNVKTLPVKGLCLMKKEEIVNAHAYVV